MNPPLRIAAEKGPAGGASVGETTACLDMSIPIRKDQVGLSGGEHRSAGGAAALEGELRVMDLLRTQLESTADLLPIKLFAVSITALALISISLSIVAQQLTLMRIAF